MKTLSVQVEQLWVPDSLDEEGAADFLAAVEVARQVRVQTWGNDDLAYTPEEFLEAFNDPYERLVVLLAKIGPNIVGRAGISMPLAENTEIAIVSLEILPRYQGGGVGRELLDAAEHFARGEMRRTVLVETHHPGTMLEDTDGRVVAAAYGDGVLPLDSREVAFAQRTGYELQQVERFSSCALPLDAALLQQLKRQAVEVSGPDYAVHTWTDTCPAEWVHDMAVLEDLMGGEESFSAYRQGDGDEHAEDTRADGVRADEGMGDDVRGDDARSGDVRGDDARVREAETLASDSGRQTMVCA
ncbi:MAG TPA: GNAT family N-acetyltransferase, partial [Arthrobacter sp.]|nr:GNAT family N-acetyltransferase [Arthrobacter sp.]